MNSTQDFGTPQDPNIAELSALAARRIAAYNSVLRSHAITFAGEPALTLTPEKPNTARAVLDVLYGSEDAGNKVGELYVILFAPGDGTGKAGDYRLGDLAIPQEYRHVEKPERVLPRHKKAEGVLIEGFFPLASVEGAREFPHLVSLEELTVGHPGGRTHLVKGISLGVPPTKYLPMVSLRRALSPTISLTCGYRRTGERFGDPHATYFNPKTAEGHPSLMQLAAFAAVETTDNPLGDVLDRIAASPR